MAKRRAVEESDDEQDAQPATKTQKRIRVSDEAPENTQDQEEEERIEAQYGEAVRASIHSNKGKSTGHVAGHGIIQSLQVHQFMCHKKLSFTFGPRVNFIIGHNGSGKSAVLSAITLALGGKAATTGRGSGLKSLIREGQAKAEVTVSVKNEGEDAYKHDIYGDSIIITRSFSKDGSSSYKIQSKAGKTISTKKEELAAICDHMNIQVENPMNILTQDAARQFLSASHPSDKYQASHENLFLKGTQLRQLNDEYEACMENIGKTAKILEQKREALPDLKKQVKEAIARFSEAKKAREQRSKIEDLQKELAWAHVKAKEEEMRNKMSDVGKAERRLPRIEKNAGDAQAAVEAAEVKVIELEKEFEQLGKIDNLSAQKRDLQDKLKENKNKLLEIATSERNMNAELERVNRTIQSFAERIEVETKKLQEDAQAKREKREGTIRDAKETMDNEQQRLRGLEEEVRTKTGELEDIAAEGRTTEEEVKRAQERIQQCSTQIQRCKDQLQNRFAPYGRDMSAVLERVRSQRWFGEVPVGPLGAYVSVTEPKWVNLMRVQIGSLMSAFAVTDSRDRATLKRILNETNNRHVQIIVSAVDLFDYSSGEPDHSYRTVLRTLKISNEYVLRILINMTSIERTFLAETRPEGQDIVDRQSHGGVAWTADLYRIQSYGDGGSNSRPLTNLRPGDPRNLMLSQADPSEQLREWERHHTEAEVQYRTMKQSMDELSQRHREAGHALRLLQGETKASGKRYLDLKEAYNTLLGEHNEDVPVNIGALEDAKRESEENKESIVSQFRAAVERKQEINEAQRPLMKEMDQIRTQIRSFEENKHECRTKIEAAVEERLKAQNSLKHYNKKLVEETQQVEDLRAACSVVEEEFEEWTASAKNICDEVEVKRSPDEVTRLLKSVQRALAEQEKEQGATIEQLENNVRLAKQRCETVDRDLRSMSALNKALKMSLNVRLARWSEFRQHIALRTKYLFQYHMMSRGFFGKVLFDHSNETLQLKVQTDEQAATQGKDKDPRSLSGGEKSFSTICLLLSLWEAIGCPIRCLDEFDVFMDAVNRRISMKMMIETAADGKQYILITPQDIGSVAMDYNIVRVHRMNDPERGQAILNF